MKKNDRVRYIGCTEEQYRWGGGEDPRKIFNIGQECIVEDAKIHDWYTLVKLERIEGKFNSVCFKKGIEWKIKSKN